MVKWRMSIMCLTFRTDSREVSDGVDTETWSTKESGNLIKSRSTQLKTSAWWISRRRQQRPNKTHSSFRQRKNSIDKIKRTTKWAQERASCAAEIWIKVYCKLPVSFDFDLNASSVRREITETLWCGCRRHCRCAHDSSEKPPGAVSNLLLVLSWFQLDHLISFESVFENVSVLRASTRPAPLEQTEKKNYLLSSRIRTDREMN